MPASMKRTKRKRKTVGARSEASADSFRRTRLDHASELAEDYVELISDLIDECGEARAVDVARRLGVSHVTVTKSIARLRADGLVESAPYRSIFLTAEGRDMARRAKERHRLVVSFLEAIGVPRPDAQIDAEGIEHHISPRTLAAMKRFLRDQ